MEAEKLKLNLHSMENMEVMCRCSAYREEPGRIYHFQILRHMQNMKIHSRALPTGRFLFIFEIKWNMFHMQNTDIIIHVLHAVQSLLSVNTHQNLDCMQYMETTLDKFCIVCRIL